MDLQLAPRIFRGFTRRSAHAGSALAHDLSEGGLAAAAAEMVLAGELGARLDPSRDDAKVRSDNSGHSSLLQSNTRFLIEVSSENRSAFENLFQGLPAVQIGVVTEDEVPLSPMVPIRHWSISPGKELKRAWQSGLDWE